jgi:hypothetical protein
MKAKISHGPSPSIMGKGGSHQIKNEYIPDVQSELDEYYQYLSDIQINLNCSEEGDKPSEVLNLILHA